MRFTPRPGRRYRVLCRGAPNLLIFKLIAVGMSVATRDAEPGRLASAPHSNGQESLAVNWDRIEGNWNHFKGRVKEQWGKLTDDDVDVIAGKRDQLVGKIQESYGITKDEAEKQVELFGGAFRDADLRNYQ
jgi:uncharacterized protein YjbJ (UPF0337 family)